MLTPYPLEPPPLLPPLDGPWEGAEAPLLSGRRARVEGSEIHLGAGLGLHDLVASPGVTARRFLALDEPCFIWEGVGVGALQAQATLIVPAGDLRCEQGEDGARLWLGATSTPRELLVGAVGGSVAVAEQGGIVRLQARGEGRLRLIVIGAEDEEDRDRTLRALARKGFGGLQAQRDRHLAQLEALALRSHTPEPTRDAELRALASRLDAALHQGSEGRLGFVDPVAEGAPLLALGLREPVRDALRAPFDDPRLLELFAAYAAWAGPDEFVRRQWPRAEAALMGAGAGAAAGIATLLLPIAEALGAHAAVSTCAAKGGGEGSPTLSIPAMVQELWGIVPDGLDGAVTFAPRLPERWPEMTLERLRIGASTLDVKVRRRPAGIAVKCRLTHGPAVVVRLAPRLDRPASGILLDEDQFPGPTLTRTLEEEFEGVWLA